MKMKKKILIIGRGDEIGGGSEYIIQLLKLLKMHFDVEIHMTYSNQNVREYYLSKIGFVNFHKIKIVRPISPGMDFLSLLNLIKLIKTEKYDIVDTNSSKGGVVGRLAAKICNVPLIIHTVHGFSFHEYSNVLSKLVYSRVERLASRWCDYIITVNDFHKEWAIKLKIASPKKIISIPNGLFEGRVATDKSAAELRDGFGISQDTVLIASIGRLAKQKGVDNLIKAASLLAKEKIDRPWKILIVGDGPEKLNLMNMVKNYNLEDSIEFMGFRKDISNILAITDIFVLLSLREGLSIAMLEAMAAKKAILASDIGPNKAILRNNIDAVLVEPKDVEKIKGQLMKLILDKEWREHLSQNAYRTFKARFDVAVMNEKYLEFFELTAGLDRVR